MLKVSASGREGGGDEELPLVVMVDFLDDASLEAEVLKGVARVECWQVEGHHALPDNLHVRLLLPSLRGHTKKAHAVIMSCRRLQGC
jgi:hypothetical protein